MNRSEVVLVLAAGRGRRMGAPKALMEVMGRPWWMHQIDAIARTGLDSLWVLSDRVARAMGRDTGALTHILAPDEAPMFESFLAGVGALRRDPPVGVYVLPVDVPLTDPGVLRMLRGAGPVAAPRCGGRAGHPLWLSWDWLENALAGEHEQRLDSLTGSARVLVDVDDPLVALNLNWRNDVERLETIWRGRND